ncbi:MAG: EAL domain-containing protein [Pseudomonadota bacterium]
MSQSPQSHPAEPAVESVSGGSKSGDSTEEAGASFSQLIETLFQPRHEAEHCSSPHGDSDRATALPLNELDTMLEGEAFQSVETGTEAEETAYVWDLASDRIEWEGNAADVLQIANTAHLGTGASFNSLLVPEHLERRLTAISNTRSSEPGRSMLYRVHYRLRPNGLRGDQTIWIEDQGRCWLDGDGRPARARGIIRRITEGYVEEQNRQHLNEFDELTGQLNRIKLTQALEAVINRTNRKGQSSGFLIASVNNLSVINESFGFDVGDEVIKSTADIIKERLRGGDTLGRYSSNKFGIILNDCGAGAMRIAAERFMKAVRSTTVSTSACQLSATISVGGIVLPEHAQSAARATSCALQALEVARQKSNDTYVAYAPSKVQESLRQRNIKLADAIISALDENRMRLLLQPMINAKSGEADIHECLLRMEKRDGTLVSAGEFVPVAEQLGLARLVDQRTLELALELLKSRPELVLSVNVSSLTTTDQDWMGTLCRSTAGRQDLTKRLIVEITETAAIDDLDRTSAFVDTLKEIGCRVAIDDFGAGYTSFKNLKHLACDIVKIDGAFVKNLADDHSDRVFIKGMVELAETFGMETVAEWVGDEGVARILIESGITYLQGFHYGLPMTINEYKAQAVPVGKVAST